METVEPVDSRPDPPRPACGLPYVRVGQPQIAEAAFAGMSEWVVRAYRFPIAFDGDAPDASFQGEVSVADPWHAGRVEAVALVGEANPPLRIAPARLILRVDGTGDDRSSARLLARARGGAAVEIQADGGDDGALDLRDLGRAGDSGATIFEVRGRAGRVELGRIYELRLRRRDDRRVSMTVPVLVKGR